MKNKAAEMKAGILKALAHPVRIMIIEALRNGERCASEINRLFDCDRTTVSKHLAVLKKAHIVKCRKEGPNIYYSLNMPCILNVFNCIENVIAEDIKRQEKLLD